MAAHRQHGRQSKPQRDAGWARNLRSIGDENVTLIRLVPGSTSRAPLSNSAIPTTVGTARSYAARRSSVERPKYPDDGRESLAVHHAKDDRWVDMADVGGGPLFGADHPLSQEERARAAREGITVPLCIVRSCLPSGRVLPTVLELYGPSELRSHPGEEFVYVLSGQVRLEVGDRVAELSEGESATFWSAEPHRYTRPPDRLVCPPGCSQFARRVDQTAAHGFCTRASGV